MAETIRRRKSVRNDAKVHEDVPVSSKDEGTISAMTPLARQKTSSRNCTTRLRSLFRLSAEGRGIALPVTKTSDPSDTVRDGGRRTRNLPLAESTRRIRLYPHFRSRETTPSISRTNGTAGGTQTGQRIRRNPASKQTNRNAPIHIAPEGKGAEYDNPTMPTKTRHAARTDAQGGAPAPIPRSATTHEARRSDAGAEHTII